MKFNTGDKVVVIYPEHREAEIGSRGTIVFIDNEETPPEIRVHIHTPKKDKIWFFEDEIELEDIYFSPLRNALREK